MKSNVNLLKSSCNKFVFSFKTLASGVYPLGVKKVRIETDSYDTNVRKAVNRLVKFDKKVLGSKKTKKRKLDDNQHEVHLRSGKKIKLTDTFNAKIADDFKELVKRDAKKKERLAKLIETSDRSFLKKNKRKRAPIEVTPMKKRKEAESSDEEPPGEIESIFRRNSGTWLVTRRESEPIKFAEEEKWDWEPKAVSEAMVESLKVPKGSGREAPTPSPIKKVKFNTKLNQAQNLDEHHQTLLTSPAIPYDASRMPDKPLLKTKRLASPINPFYLNDE